MAKKSNTRDKQVCISYVLCYVQIWNWCLHPKFLFYRYENVYLRAHFRSMFSSCPSHLARPTPRQYSLTIGTFPDGGWMHAWSKYSLLSSRCGQCPQAIRPRTSLAPPDGGGTLKKGTFPPLVMLCHRQHRGVPTPGFVFILLVRRGLINNLNMDKSKMVSTLNISDC